ncbi:MAG TPA: glycosyltransferase family 2 protein [Steroidobacteraceae bacterium]|nr:glycosyltransferase family 2 protein [Steroidobacteraceae bacterium]
MMSSADMQSIPVLTVVIPCYNENEVLPETNKRMAALLDQLTASGKIAATSQVMYVDDGSKDGTWEMIKSFHAVSARVAGLKLSANRGHQTALMAGLFAAAGDVVISVDADLQDDLAAIEQMLDAHRNGSEIVFGVRKQRTADTMFKRNSAQTYYRLLKLLGVNVVFNHADYRLLGRRALEALKQYSEVNLFLRGIVPLLGFKSTTVFYDRAERFAGESKYPLRKMLVLAFDGITSFTAFPLRLISIMGVLVSLASAVMIGWVLWVKLFTSEALPGWASSVIPIYFLGGLQLLSIGVLGEYVAKIYAETKRRPRYFIEETV